MSIIGRCTTVAAVFASAIAEGEHGKYCPVSASREADAFPKVSFLEITQGQQEPDPPLEISTSSGKSAGGKFQVDFKPAHFTCSKCDADACNGAFVMCDISSCTGKFYTQECWCKTEYSENMNKPLWNFRPSDSKFLPDSSISQFFCDDDCTGGVCDTEGQVCKTREAECKPWWWCGADPPQEMPVGGIGGNEFRMSMLQQGDASRRLSAVRKSAAARSATRHAQRRGGSSAGGRARAALLKSRVVAARMAAHEVAKVSARAASADHHFAENDFGKFDFKDSRFICGSASIPPKVQSAQTFLWSEQGYMIFDKHSCSGSAFENQCFCWDNFLYLSGKDPLTSELMCDDTCEFGGCDGKHCSKYPPPALPPPQPAMTQKPVLRKSKNMLVPSAE